MDINKFCFTLILELKIGFSIKILHLSHLSEFQMNIKVIKSLVSPDQD